jgi:hypothetical protein
MGRQYNVRLIFITSFLLAVCIIGIVGVSQAHAQDDAISRLERNLKSKGVPVKEVKIKSRLPFRVEIVTQSTTSTQTAAPDDAFNQAIIHLETSLARRRGDKFERVQETVVNTNGQEIYSADLDIDPGLEKARFSPSLTDNTIVEKELREKIPLGQLFINNLSVTQDMDGAHVITMTLSTQDLSSANTSVAPFMTAVNRTTDELMADNGARFATLEIIVNDANGQPLLKYFKEFLPADEREYWWQADGMTQDWFPHPPLPKTHENHT